MKTKTWNRIKNVLRRICFLRRKTFFIHEDKDLEQNKKCFTAHLFFKEKQ